MIITNPSVSYIYQQALVNDKLEASDSQALLAYSGKYTGRCPESKRIVKDDLTEKIWWGDVNKPITPELFYKYISYAKNTLLKPQEKPIYRIVGYAGWDKPYQQVVTVYCEEAYQALFMKNMLVEINIDDENIFKLPNFTIYNLGQQKLNEVEVSEDIKDKTLDDTLVALNLTSKEMVIYGTRYAGEMKKGLLTWMMFCSQLEGALCLHSSANKQEDDEDVSLFFGMSGTGKTTLSADPNRVLIGDDEHVWTNTGIFNVEGGCYAKCINLSKKNEPEIYDAIRYGSVLENVVVDKDGVVDFKDDSITQNTRCSYPLLYIPNAVCKNIGVGKHPERIIFLTCDVLGVLPAISRLTNEEAITFFLSGYTSKMTGTEEGVTEPTLTFSACFGEPFLIWHPVQYANLLKEKIERHNTPVWLINTGWALNHRNNDFSRIPLRHTRRMIDFIHKYDADEIDFTNHTKEYLNKFDFYIPKNKYLSTIPDYILYPFKTINKKKWEEKINLLSEKFTENWHNKIDSSLFSKL